MRARRISDFVSAAALAGALISAEGCSSSSTGSGSAATSDAASFACQPATTGFVPVHVTPIVKNACTQEQVKALVANCFAPDLTNDTACRTWLAANGPCFNGCPVISPYAIPPDAAVPPPAPSWGPYIAVENPGTSYFFNLGACVALADPSLATTAADGSKLACSDAYTEQTECEIFACAGSCPVPEEGSAPAQDAFEACIAAADTGLCAPEVAAANECTTLLMPNSGATPPAAFCLDLNASIAASTSADGGVEGGVDSGAVGEDPLTAFIILECASTPRVVDSGAADVTSGG